MALNPKQARFVEEYLCDLNGTQAAIRAGYSERTAEKIAWENLRKPEIAEAVAARQADRAQRTEVTQDRVLLELARIGFSSIEHFVVDDNGRFELADGAPDGAMRAISSVKHKVRRIPQGPGAEPIVEHDVEYRLWDKNTALANLGKHLGMFVEKVEHSGSINTPSLTVVVKRGTDA